jgi:hypothetical protein
LSVKPKLTFGWLFSPYSCFGSVMSVPESAGLSRRANQPGLAVLSTVPDASVGYSETRIVPAGISTTIPSFGSFLPVGLT